MSEGAFSLHGTTSRLRARGVREVLDPELARGPGTAGAALAMLRRIEAETGQPAVIVGAIAFDPYRPAHLWVPRAHALDSPAPRVREAAEGRGVEIDDPGYRAAVEVALQQIAEGKLTKVVLARAVDVVAEEPVDVDLLHATLAAANVGAYAFSVQLDDGGVLLGASPELLVRVSGRQVVSNPLAGSTPRGATPEADERARSQLSVSGKDLGEHRLVVTAVDSVLARLTVEIDTPTEPSLSSTEHLWHLSTTVTGELRTGVTALDVAYALHPTPAVCGVPATSAARLIADVETSDRGFYAGLVGWMDSAGNGEWVLALRSGVVRGNHVRVHAGAGVVAASTADGEHAETGTKLQTFLRSLDAVVPDYSISPAADALVGPRA